MFRRSRRFPLAALALTAALSSCHFGPHGMDFSPLTDRYQQTVDDEVILDSDTRGGSTPIATPPELAAAAAPAPASFAAAPAPAVQPALTPATAGGTYVVKAGDTLNAVARRHNTTPAALAAANGLTTTSLLKIGQKLQLPAAGIVSHGSAAKPTAAAKAQPAKTAAKTAGKSGHHTVQAGETLYAIARKHNVSPAALMQANKLTPQTAGKLRIGSTLTIPAK